MSDDGFRYHDPLPGAERARLVMLVTLWSEMGYADGAEVREHGNPEAEDTAEAARSLLALDTAYRHGGRVALVDRKASELEGYIPGVVAGAYLGCLVQAALKDVLRDIPGPVDFVTAHAADSPQDREDFRRAYEIVRSYTLTRYDELRTRAAVAAEGGEEAFASTCIRCLAVCRSLAAADVVEDSLEAPGPLGELHRLSESWRV